MAVYTHVSREELEEFLQNYDLGSLKNFQGIAQGVSNTNYFVTSDAGRFVLTLFEARRVDEKDIPVFLDYMDALDRGSVPCPKTVRGKNGAWLSTLNGRPAALFTVIDGVGASNASITADMCVRAGAMLADMHLASRTMTASIPNRFGQERWRQWLTVLGNDINTVSPGLFRFAAEEYDWVVSRWPKELPSGAIHADYFPDNVFFDDSSFISGVIDFHFVCADFFAYDLAIALSTWAFDEKNNYRADRMDAFLEGYQSARPLSVEETRALPVLLRGAALRFLLSRLEEKLMRKPGDLMEPHDPMVYEARLRHFQAVSPL